MIKIWCDSREEVEKVLELYPAPAWIVSRRREWKTSALFKRMVDYERQTGVPTGQMFLVSPFANDRRNLMDLWHRWHPNKLAPNHIPASAHEHLRGHDSPIFIDEFLTITKQHLERIMVGKVIAAVASPEPRNFIDDQWMSGQN